MALSRITVWSPGNVLTSQALNAEFDNLVSGVNAAGGVLPTAFTIGDLVYASTTAALSALADVATGNALISGGVGVAPSWGKIGLTTHVTGILPGANGGTANGFFAVAGPATSLKTFTFPNASDTVATLGVANTFTAIQTISLASAVVNSAEGTRHLILRSTDAVAADLGPQMSFSGASGGATTPNAFATIAGRKEGATAYAGYLQFATTAGSSGVISERMRIDSTGNVGIGTTTPSSPLVIYAPGDAAQIRFGITDTSNQFTTIGRVNSTGYTHFIAAQTTFSGFRFFVNNTTEVLSILNSGNIGIGTTSPTKQLELSTDSAQKPTTNTWTITSDARIKTIQRKFIDGLDIVRQINPVWYRYNGKGGMVDNGEHVGIIAQELQPVAPYMIGVSRGRLVPNEAETDILDYQGHALPFILVNAIKTLDARLTAGGL